MRIFRSLAMGAATALGLAACQMPVSIDTPPLPVSLTASGQALATEGTSVVAVRSFLNVGENRVRIEDLIGARCTVESPYFKPMTFSTPQKIALPSLGARDPEARVTCRHNGERQSQALACFVLRGAPDACSFADVSIIFGRK